MKIPDVREKFKQTFTKPRYTIEHDMVASPVTKNYSLVGTAFDYLLRFQLEHWYTSATSAGWVAEISLFMVEEDTPRHKYIRNVLDICREEHYQFIRTGEITKGILKTCLVLAQLDVIFRRTALVSDFMQFDDGDLQDLRTLIKSVPPNMFDHNKLCLLDPTFGDGSILVRGADVDLVIDDMIIDIKTTINPLLQLEHFRQLVGYYLLYRYGGITGAPEGHTINRLGIYYSRFAELVTFDVKDIIPIRAQDEFLPWFVERAKSEYQNR